MSGLGERVAVVYREPFPTPVDSEAGGVMSARRAGIRDPEENAGPLNGPYCKKEFT